MATLSENFVRRTHPDALTDVAPEWAAWCVRWKQHSPLPTRSSLYNELLLVGRWLTLTHPQMVSPEQWTRQTALDYVAAVSRMRIGEWSLWQDIRQRGQPLRPSTKQHKLSVVRRFFTDCQAWNWLPRHFDPLRWLVFAPSLEMEQVPVPCVIDDSVWAKLLWAGLALTEADMACFGRKPVCGFVYPFALMRAAALTWLFGALRAGELRRLRLGCVHLEQAGERTVCWLDVPPAKSRSGLSRPVDLALAEAVQRWEVQRAPTERAVDEVTGERVHFLFQNGRQRIGVHFLNKTLIPLLCAKAGVPQSDTHGRLTSHRARTTIASQLANAPEPMPLLVLQDWLGHRTPKATLNYVRASGTTLTHAYRQADYFAHNVRTMTVFIDRQAVEQGAAASGTAWKYYDLGHGYCTYDFFERCPHRMACARCGFYRAKPETEAQLLEGQQHYLRLLQDIPLTDEEQAAVEADLAAVTRLTTRLQGLPTPDSAGFVPLTAIS
jgi:integrase